MPWQVEVVLCGLGMLASGVTVLCGTAFLTYLSDDALKTVSAALGGQAQISSPVFAQAWPLLLFVFAVLSIRFYLAFRRLLTRKLDVV